MASIVSSLLTQPTEPEYGVPQEQLDDDMKGGDFVLPGKNTGAHTHGVLT